MKFRYGQNKQADEIVERMIRENIKDCQSCLVDELIRNEFDGFGIDDIENMYAEPSGWEVDEIYEFADDNGIELDNDPRHKKFDDLIEICEEIGLAPEGTNEEVQELIAEGQIDDWRDAIRDWSSDNPNEALQWFAVDSWLCGELREIGEIVIDNGYGCWWGRGCCGQSIALDPTFYVIAERNGCFDDIKPE